MGTRHFHQTLGTHQTSGKVGQARFAYHIDWEGVADSMEHDGVTFIEKDGEVFVFINV